MSDYLTTYKHVSREVFDRVSDRVHDDPDTRVPITVYYNGTHLYGDLTIEAYGGNSKSYKKRCRYLTKNIANKN